MSADRRRNADQHHGQHQRTVHGQQQIRGGVHVDAAAISSRTHNRRYTPPPYLLTDLFMRLVVVETRRIDGYVKFGYSAIYDDCPLPENGDFERFRCSNP